MNIKSKSFNIRELESLFAEDFNSPIFPVLADYYLNTSQLDKALKVIQLGLKHSPDNYLGQYVLAKVYNSNGHYMDTLTNQNFQRGEQVIYWEPKIYSSGIYFIQISDFMTSQTQKVIYLK